MNLPFHNMTLNYHYFNGITCCGTYNINGEKKFIGELVSKSFSIISVIYLKSEKAPFYSLT